MGFQRKPYKLVWSEKSIWHGLEVRLRGMSIGELKTVAKLKSDDNTLPIEKLDPVIEIIQSAMIDWNYEDEENVPIPVSEFGNQDYALIIAILHAWQGVIDVPAPLPESSPNGKSLAEVSIPMVIPSSSHLS